MKRDYYVTPKPSRIMLMLWRAAGGDRYILERATYADQVKYACLGGIIFATGGMAALAGGYAFYTIFEPKTASTLGQSATDIPTLIISLFFGLIWGLIIFNIDRFIVTSTGKGDGTEAITWDEFKSAIPRIIMGTIIAFTISKPIEIRMFKSEIDVKLANVQDSLSNAFVITKNVESEKRIKILKERIENYNKEVTLKYDAYKQNQKRYLEECQGFGSPGRGCGPIAESIRKQMMVDSIEYTKIEKRNEPLLATCNEEILQEDSIKKVNKLESIKVAEGLDGLLERIKICHEVAGGWITTFITLLFLTIELTPIFFKLMLIKTPYDYLTENRDDLIKAENGIEVRYDYYKDKEGLERHLVINHAADKLVYEKHLLALAEKELNRYAVRKYVENEKQKIDENPALYINVGKENNEG
jgi:hypothetical protein